MLTFKEGGGVLNSLINNLPVELHLPNYQYCGPGTKLQKRLRRGDQGINPLDAACKEHDIAYSKNKDLKERHKADQILEDRAWNRVKSADTSLGERVAALLISGGMKVKRKLGMGSNLNNKLKRKTIKKRKKRGGGLKRKIPFRRGVIMQAKAALNKSKLKDIAEGAKISLAAAKMAVKKVGGSRNIKTPRVIPIPKSGGFIPLIPLFAGLSALGGLAGGAAGIAQAVNKAKASQKLLEEAQRHNKVMEDVALSKKGQGLYLKPYKKGMGLYLKPYKQTKNY